MWKNWATCTYFGMQFEHCGGGGRGGRLFFITRLILVRIWSKGLPRYRSTIIKSIWGTVLTTTFCLNTLPKSFFFFICQRSHMGKYFYYTRYFSIYLFHDGVSQNTNTNWSIGTSVIQLNRFCRFINTTEGLFPINISGKFSFFTKNIDV